ncbi:MAG TPA: hypothetical protein VK658_23275 [Chryseolinea sp.]|nr:hypothetical protein [Chryseolinea sp.]
MTFVFAFQIFEPPVSYALTSGPTQPEVQSFQPAGTSEMVDLFSGDFVYNIPLFELPGPNGGYPFNIAYQSGITMDSEASWVGLGWSLQPGALTRQMRGVPDEFNGDSLHTKMSIEPSVTVGLGAGVGAEFFGGSVDVGLGFSVSHNNYKGMGYSIDGSVGFEKASQDGMGSGIGLNVSLNSKEGVNVNPSLGLATKMGKVGLGVGYNSKDGLSTLSLSVTPKERTFKDTKGKEHTTGRITDSQPLSLAHPGYTPQVSMPMRNVGISATFKAGVDWWGIFSSAYVTGFYNEQYLADNKKRVASRAYGYLNYQDAPAESARTVLDVNREKDGMVTKESPNLSIPSLTYDIYSATGQGISAMYRPMRNDYGIVHDPETSSSSVGGSGGVDVAPVATHAGVNANVNHSRSVSGPWNDNNDMTAVAKFQGKTVNDTYEPWYFKVHGEASSDRQNAALFSDEALRVRLKGSDAEASADDFLEGRSGGFVAPNSKSLSPERKQRNQIIQAVTKAELMNNGQEVLSYFKIKYLDHNGVEQVFNRSSHKDHHTAGFTALTAEGLRYNYGIPAYNLHQEEVVYTARKQPGQDIAVNVGDNGQGDPKYDYDETEKFLKRVETPAYAHSYLLTSVLGPDYVDVTGDGVTEDDLGYWVNFTYRRTASGDDSYKWRDPFSKAHLHEGWKTDPRDDKGSFVYGEKEIWYLAKAETKSHIATFITEAREDGRGVDQKLQDTNATGTSLHLLRAIKLFTRSAGTSFPIKVVRFDYDYSLCQGVINSNTGNGKLTLKKLWFEYGNSQRGQLNPYVFTYHANNPDYSMYAYDRWGGYKPYPAGDVMHNIDFPYAVQDPSRKTEIDNNAAAWSLQRIQLPSGAEITVDYESDDYAYVQHLPAMQMMDVVGPEGGTESGDFLISDASTKIRFRLEKLISGTLTPEQQQVEVMKYLDQRRGQLYFKLKINLRSPAEDFYEYVSGYADIDLSPATMGLEGSSGSYVYGYFHLKKEDGYHPFSLRAWQHLRTNQPDLANSGRKLKATSNNEERINQIKSLGSIGAQVRQMFEGFNKYCAGKNWGRELVAGKSWIRLNSPDKIKFGGGLRVKQVTMKDNWQGDTEGIYGQVYNYTIDEEGQTISSGVATYEPFTGGDENALRYAKKFVQSIPMRSDNNLFFEYPINESYYPGPSIGYRKVTITSLAAARLSGNTLATGNDVFPHGEGIGYGTSGATVHEFYTAKDFPVMTYETEKANKTYRLQVAVPLLGHVSISKLATTQGYSIITNDMHGKQKKVSNYRQDKFGNIDSEPVSWVEYKYRSNDVIYDQQKVMSVVNVFKDNADGTLSIPTTQEVANPGIAKYTIGQENEFFIDMRQYEDNSWGGGVRGNLDIVWIPILFAIVSIPVPTVWPSVGKSSNQLRMAVANKVIFKTGVIDSVKAYDGGSLVVTRNIKWDKQTGVPVLTSVNNNFDAPVYSLNIPAYSRYRGMGAAYQNIGMMFEIADVDNLPYHDNFYQFSLKENHVKDKLFPGDEILLYDNNSEFKSPVAKVVFTGEEHGDMLLHSGILLTETAYKAIVVRSGYRNQLSVSAGSIIALNDPSLPGTPVTHSRTITVPRNN